MHKVQGLEQWDVAKNMGILEHIGMYGTLGEDHENRR